MGTLACPSPPYRSFTKWLALLIPLAGSPLVYGLVRFFCITNSRETWLTTLVVTLLLSWQNRRQENHAWKKEGQIGLDRQGAQRLLGRILVYDLLLLLIGILGFSVLYQATLWTRMRCLQITVLACLGGHYLSAPLFWGRTYHHVQGTKLVSLSEAQHLVRSLVGSLGGNAWVWWCGLRFPDIITELHFILFGVTRAGKNILLTFLLKSPSILPAVGQGRGVRLVLIDVKRNLIPLLRAINHTCRILFLHPFADVNSPGCTVVGLDLAGDVRTIAEAEEVAALICPDPNPGTDEFWPEAARLVIGAVIVALMNQMRHTGRRCAWPTWCA